MRLLFWSSVCVAALTSTWSCGEFGTEERTPEGTPDGAPDESSVQATDGGDATTTADRYFVAVGALPGDGGPPTRSTSFTRVRPDGTIADDWKQGPELLADIQRYGLLTTLGSFHVFGGYPHDFGPELAELSSSKLSSDGTFSPFAKTSLPDRVADSTPVIAKGRAYTVVPGMKKAYFATVLSSGAIDGWSLQQDLNPGDAGTPYGFAAAAAGHVFYLGHGKRGLVAEPMTDGNLGQWRSLAPLPLYLWTLAGVAVGHDRFLYLVGGYPGDAPGGIPVSQVYVAEVDGNGTPGNWRITAPFPGPRTNYGVVVNNGHIYVIGGNNGAAVSDISYAKILPNGSLEPWTKAGDLPIERRAGAYGFVER